MKRRIGISTTREVIQALLAKAVEKAIGAGLRRALHDCEVTIIVQVRSLPTIEVKNHGGT